MERDRPRRRIVNDGRQAAAGVAPNGGIFIPSPERPPTEEVARDMGQSRREEVRRASLETAIVSLLIVLVLLLPAVFANATRAIEAVLIQALIAGKLLLDRRFGLAVYQVWYMSTFFALVKLLVRRVVRLHSDDRVTDVTMVKTAVGYLFMFVWQHRRGLFAFFVKIFIRCLFLMFPIACLMLVPIGRVNFVVQRP